jgi:hypothetical protein
MLGIRAILDVGARADANGIYLIEPFDPNRIPVLLLLGLTSSPLVWRNVATDAMENPLIRKNFQFWYASIRTAARILVKNPETWRDAAFQAGSSCKTSKETSVFDFCSLFRRCLAPAMLPVPS